MAHDRALPLGVAADTDGRGWQEVFVRGAEELRPAPAAGVTEALSMVISVPSRLCTPGRISRSSMQLRTI
jgi:hypothetical protein